MTTPVNQAARRSRAGVSARAGLMGRRLNLSLGHSRWPVLVIALRTLTAAGGWFAVRQNQLSSEGVIPAPEHLKIDIPRPPHNPASSKRLGFLFMKSLLVASALLAAGCVAGAAEARGTIESHGLYRVFQEKAALVSPESISGVKRVAAGMPILVSSTERVPARIGACFGLFYEITNTPAVNGPVYLTTICRHPVIHKPDGTVAKGFVSTDPHLAKNGRIVGWAGYHFDQDYELAEGGWNFEIQLNGATMIQQAFTVFAPPIEGAKVATTVTNAPMVKAAKKRKRR